MGTSVENLVAKIKTLPEEKQRSISAILGATVADVATRPLHWIYNQDVLDNVIGNTKEIEFWHESKCPFFTIPLGQPTAYNDTSLVSLTALNETNGELNVKHICESFKKHFGEGTDYADALARRKIAYNPETKSDVVGPIEGPWIHKAMLLFLENYEKGEKGDAECKEYDVFCAVLPIIAMHAGKDDMWSQAQNITSLFTSNAVATEMFHTSALLVNNCIIGKSDPIAEVKKTVESLYPNVHELMNEVEEAKPLPYASTVATFGKACYLPGTFQGGLLTLLRTSSFVDAVRLNITGGGCNGGRGNFIGAYYGAKDGIDGIPLDWLKKVRNIEKIIEMAINVISSQG